MAIGQCDLIAGLRDEKFPCEATELTPMEFEDPRR